MLIFACMAMIIIFNMMSDKLVDNAEGESAHVLAPQSMILTLEYPGGTIERLGRNWRVTRNNDVSSISAGAQQQLAQQLINHWLLLAGELKLIESDEPGYRVVVWLAGEQDPRRFWLQPQAGLITEILSQKTWQLAPPQVAQLNFDSLLLNNEL